MRTSDIRALIELNNTFYRTHASSFSDTRRAPWQGWGRVLMHARGLVGMDAGGRGTSAGGSAACGGAAGEAGAVACDPRAASPGDSPAAPRALTVIDVAAGNLRFERMLATELGDGVAACHAVDGCVPLAAAVDLPPRTTPHMVDILAELLAGRDPLAGLPTADLTVCFGFMHHVPGRALRLKFLETLLDHTRPGGMVALSLWRFMDDVRLAAKALERDGAARRLGAPADSLEEGDHFLGWQDDADALRYCHHFSPAEANELVRHLASCGASVIDRYDADGRSGRLNHYLIARRDRPWA